jgi:hypothetical protein
VQQSIREGGLQLALALLPTQGPAAATAAFLEVLNEESCNKRRASFAVTM